MKKIGLLGGSFDPIHLGHIHLAKTVYKKLDLDEVWFLPTVKTPLKDKELTSIRHRKKMIEMLIKPYRHFKVSMIEEKNTIPSYSINTARLLKKMHPDYQFYWLIGSDILGQLDSWKDIDELKQLVTFICVQRDPKETSKEVLMVDAEIHPASSTQVRNGNFNYIPTHLRRYIMDNYLYQESISKQVLSEKRWQHVQSVADLCVTMAKGNGVDVKKAYCAGIYHDYAKELDSDSMEMYMKLYNPNEMALNYNVWHQFVGASILSSYFKLSDREVLKAIRHHAIGDGEGKLSKILYCADKLDPTRGYDSKKEIELCISDIELGYKVVKQQQLEYLKKEGVL